MINFPKSNKPITEDDIDRLRILIRKSKEQTKQDSVVDRKIWELAFNC